MSPGAAEADPPTPSGLVQVRRSGGFAGRSLDGVVDLDGEDPRAAEVAALVGRIDFAAVRAGSPRPDMFVYSFSIGGRRPVQVPEQQLSPELARLATVVLDPDR